MKKTLSILLAMICIAAMAQNQQIAKDDLQQLQKLNKAVYMIATGYVDTVNTEQLVNTDRKSVV